MKLSVVCLMLALAPAAAFAQPQATPAAEEATDSWSHRNETRDLSRYNSFIIEPTAVSSDPAAKWGKATEAEKQKYADLFTRALRDEIGKSYTLATSKGPGVGVMRLTLLGVTPTSPIAVASRVTPIGFALNSVKSMAGKPGSFSGSAQVAFEMTDSQSGELVVAVVRRRSPDALDIGATTSTESTVAAIAKDVASAVRGALDRAHGR
jgi:hypothetical protein